MTYDEARADTRKREAVLVILSKKLLPFMAGCVRTGSPPVVSV